MNSETETTTEKGTIMNAETTITALLDELNAYEGDNIWQDVILTQPGYDEDSTVDLDPNGRSDVAVVGGHVLRWIEQDHEWIDRGMADTATIATETVTIVIDAVYDLSAAGLLPDLRTVSDEDYEAAEAAYYRLTAEFEAACDAVAPEVGRDLGVNVEVIFAAYGSPEASKATPAEDEQERTARVWQAVQDAAGARIDAAAN